MNIYIIRHGQSYGNLGGELAYDVDPKLTDLGIAQADKTGIAFENIKIDLLLSSPYIRAQQTAAGILKHQKSDVRVEVHENLRETGTEIGYEMPDEYVFENPVIIKSDIVCQDSNDCENYNSKRAETVINYVLGLKEKYENIVIVAHGSFNGFLMFDALLKIDRSRIALGQCNCCINKFEVEDKIKIRCINSWRHLPDDMWS